MQIRSWVLVASIVLSLAGCGGGNKDASAAAPSAPPAAAPPAAAPAPSPPAAPAGPVSDTVNDPSFTMRLVPAGPYKSGELGRFVLELEPHGVFHINQEYPFEATLTAGSDVTMPKVKLEKADAAEFAEKKARFDVPFTPKMPGEQKVSAHVRFAVCTDENCVPDERDLALSFTVN